MIAHVKNIENIKINDGSADPKIEKRRLLLAILDTSSAQKYSR